MEEVAFLEELREAIPRPAAKRLTPQHLEFRDQALGAIERALNAVERLQALERGEVGDPIRSPRHDGVRLITTELRSLCTRLEEVYT